MGSSLVTCRDPNTAGDFRDALFLDLIIPDIESATRGLTARISDIFRGTDVSSNLSMT
jgi:hypothetical protein